MLNKKNILYKAFFLAVISLFIYAPAFCEEANVDEEMENLSAEAVADFNVEGSLFEQITTLEQDKVLMQLEKEKAQLDLELDRLAAEKIKLHMEIDTLSGRAEQQKQELENAQAKLQAEAEKLAREKEAFAEETKSAMENKNDYTDSVKTEENNEINFSDNYRLVNIFGVGSQLQATIKDLQTGQDKKVSVGKIFEGYTVKSISLDDGIVFVKDGDTQTLNVVSNAQ